MMIDVVPHEEDEPPRTTGPSAPDRPRGMRREVVVGQEAEAPVVGKQWCYEMWRENRQPTREREGRGEGQWCNESTLIHLFQLQG